MTHPAVLWGRVYEPAGDANDAAPDNPNTRHHTPCVMCDQPVDPDDAHWPHQAGCTRHDCDCDLPTCPGCCPDCSSAQGVSTDLMETTP